MRRPIHNLGRHSRRGFFEIEILGGLVLVAALAFALTAVLGRQHRAALKLADTRAAAQTAEAVLTDLQAGRAVRLPGRDAEALVDVHPANESPEAGAGNGVAIGAPAAGVPGKWVEVVISIRGGRATLVGLVPSNATLPPAGGAP
jgi:hypothetical protein